MTDGANAANSRTILIAGASGVIGSAAVEHFARDEGWKVIALSRRQPAVTEGLPFTHCEADLRDPDACAQLVASLPPITHLIYAAVSEAPGLVSGWRDPELIATNGLMFENLLQPLAETGSLFHVSLLQGTKAYGAHIHPVKLPLREDAARDDHTNFYWLHEDCARTLGTRHGFSFTIFRPQVLMGTAPGAAMNPVAPIGAYAAICHERGLPFALPGDSETIWEMVDATLLARAMDWAAGSPEAANQTFNLTNGDIFVLRHVWNALADGLGLSASGEAPENFASFFADPANQASWKRIAAKHGLKIDILDDLLGQSHHYLDLLIGPKLAARTAPSLLSTIKLRQSGFLECIDSFQSLIRQLEGMMRLRLLPWMGKIERPENI